MNPLFLMSGLGMMAVALAAVVYWRRRTRAAFVLFLWGALAWLVGNVLKSVAAIPLPAAIEGARAVLPGYLSEPILWLYIGLLTGIFECGTVLGFAHLRRMRIADWREAVAFGLGFGAIEAFLLGAYSFTVILLIILIPGKLPPELLELAATQSESLLGIPVPVIERAVVVPVHTFSCALIIYAVQTKEWKWYWASFIYKTALDTIAGLIQITYGVHNLTTLGTWIVELILLPFGVIGVWGLGAFRDRWPSQATLDPARGETAQTQSDQIAC